jgi:hypothetical protein
MARALHAPKESSAAADIFSFAAAQDSPKDKRPARAGRFVVAGVLFLMFVKPLA